MSKDYKEALNCAGKIHCKKCRDFVGGRKWRTGILSLFPDLQTPDYACPYEQAWIHSPARRKKKIASNTFAALVLDIDALSDDTEAAKWLKASSAQLRALIKENRGDSLAEQAAYRRRLQDKLRFYAFKYGPPSLAAKYPFVASTAVQSPMPGFSSKSNTVPRKAGCGCYGARPDPASKQVDVSFKLHNSMQ